MGNLGQAQDAAEPPGQTLVMGDHQEARPGLGDLSEQKIQKRRLGRGIQRGSRLVRHDQRRPPDQGARHRHALLLPDAQIRGAGTGDQILGQAERSGQAQSLGRRIGDLAAPRARKPQRQQDIVQGEAKGSRLNC